MTGEHFHPPSSGESARHYIELGLGVIPLRPRQKMPRLTAWQHKFFTTPEQVDAHWGDHPEDGVGLVCGERTGILVLDVDVKHGGLGSLKELVSIHGGLPPTVEARTGGGGSHYLFRYPSGHRIKTRSGVRPGIDVRAGFTDEDDHDQSAGQIAVYPSKHPDTGERYEWVRPPWDAAFAETPAWLIELLEERPATRTYDEKDRVPAGERHDFLVREAGRLRNLNYTSELIGGMLRTLFETRCEPMPPMTEDEIGEIARWVEQKEPAVRAASPSATRQPAVIPIERPPTTTFPIEALPTMTRDALVRLAEAQDVSIDYVASQALVIAAAAIGTTRVIKTHTDDRLVQRPQPALLYLAVIGDPGTAKTESRYFLEGAIKRKEEQYVAEFERRTAAFTQEQGEVKQRRDDLTKQHNAAVTAWIKAGGKGAAPESPDGMIEAESGGAPQPQHAWTDSATIEGIADALHTSPRGLLVCPDELAKLWLGFNKYGGGAGNDKQHFLEAWNAGSWNIIRADRKRNKHIPRAHISIVGGLQPDLLPMIRGEYDDGTLDRWLCVWPEVTWLAKAKVADLSFLGTWDTLVGKLFSLGWGHETEPELVLLDADALAVWRVDYGIIAGRYAIDEGRLKGLYAKWGQYWARLALVLHLLKWAEGDRVDPQRVDGETARAATALMDYFTAMATKVRAQIGPADATDGTDGVRGCERCGSPLTGKQRSARFCGDNCRKRAYDAAQQV